MEGQQMAKFKIGDKVYLPNRREVNEYTIIGINGNCNTEQFEYSIKRLPNPDEDDFGCEVHRFKKEESLFTNKEELLLKIQTAFQECIFKEHDLVVYKRKLCYVSKLIFDPESEQVKLELSNLTEPQTWHSTLANLDPAEIHKVNKKHIPNILKYKQLYSSCEELDKKLAENKQELVNLITETKDEIDFYFKTFTSWRGKIFKSEEFKQAKLLFDESKHL